MNDLSKSEAQHAARRAVQRFGLDYTPELRDEIIGHIQSGRSTPLDRRSQRSATHRVKLNDGLTVTVAYDSLRKEVVTFLPNRGLADELLGPQKRRRRYTGKVARRGC
jgi:hypothetical protein